MFIYSLRFFFVAFNTVKEAMWSVKPVAEKQAEVSIEIAWHYVLNIKFTDSGL